jgi:hypothetical protein
MLTRMLRFTSHCLGVALRWGLPLFVVTLWLDSWDRLLPWSRPVTIPMEHYVSMFGASQGRLCLNVEHYSSPGSRIIYRMPYEVEYVYRVDLDRSFVYPVLWFEVTGPRVRASSNVAIDRFSSFRWEKWGFAWRNPTRPLGGGVFTTWYFQIPMWLVLAISLVPMLLYLWKSRRVMRRAKARGRATCAFCGYDLRASKDRCPECGAAIPGGGVGSGGGERPSATVV